MANIFYYAPLIYTPLQMGLTRQYTHVPESSLFIMPLLHTEPSFLQIQS